MRALSIMVAMAVCALVSGPCLAKGGAPSGTARPPGADRLFIRSSQIPCADRIADLRPNARTRSAVPRSTPCDTLARTAGRSPCVNSAPGLPLALLDTAATTDDKIRLANLKIRRAYFNAFLKAHGINPVNYLVEHAGRVACFRPAAALSNPALGMPNPAAGLSFPPVTSTASLAVAGGNAMSGFQSIFALVGATAGTATGVAALATGGTSPASP